MKAFAGNDDVSFGDVNLSEEPIRGEPHNPGAGGWPTIRYFNKNTGIDGANYEKKTSKSMCDELGDEEMMVSYIEEAGGTSVCSLSDGSGCSEKELGYIKKMRAKEKDEVISQLRRLEGMEGESMKPELMKWLKQRKKILKHLAKAHDEL